MNAANQPPAGPAKPDGSPPPVRRRDARVLLVAAGVGALSWLVFLMTGRHPAEGPEGEAGPLKPLDVALHAGGVEGAFRPELVRALGLAEEECTGTERLLLLRSFGGDLSEEEREALLADLSRRRPASVPAGWYSEYMHEIGLLLRRQPEGFERFARVLAAVAADSRRDDVVRDYALQHLRGVWDRTAKDPELRASIEATFREFAGNDPALSASALLSLHLMGTGDEGVEPGHIRMPVALDRSYRIDDAEIHPVVASILAGEPSADTLKSRMTALRVVGDRRLASLRPDLRRIASDTGEHALARMAAIAALARFSDPSDQPFIESLDRRDPRIDEAVRHALVQLR